MAKIDPADNPVVYEEAAKSVTLDGSPPVAPGKVSTETEVEEMIQTYKEMKKTPTLSKQDAKPLLPDWAWIGENGRLFASPPGWESNVGLSETRKDIVQYRAGGHSKSQIMDIVGSSDSGVYNACRVFSFLLDNEETEWSVNNDAAELLLKTFAGPPRNHPQYELGNEKTYECDYCGKSFDGKQGLGGHASHCSERPQNKDEEEDKGKEEPSDESEELEDPTPVESRGSTGDVAVVGKSTTDTTSSTEEPTESALSDSKDVLCVSDVMDRGEWRETIRILLNADDPKADEKAERLMEAVTNWPGE